MSKIRPIPADMRGWINEVAGIHRYLNEIALYAPPQQATWAVKQFTYYNNRLELLLSNPPPVPTRHHWLKIQSRYARELMG